MKEILEKENIVEKKSGIKKGNRKDGLQFLLIVLVIVLFVIVLALGWYIFDVLNGKLNRLGKTDTINIENSLDLSKSDTEAGEVLEKVSKHILLPARDFQVYTVNDASILWKENPVLYQYVLNGNKLIVYETGMIVYDSMLDKVVDVVQNYPVRQQLLKEAVPSTLQENK